MAGFELDEMKRVTDAVSEIIQPSERLGLGDALLSKDEWTVGGSGLLAGKYIDFVFSGYGKYRVFIPSHGASKGQVFVMYLGGRTNWES